MSVALGPWVTPPPVLDDVEPPVVVVVIDDPDVVIEPVVVIDPVVDVILEPVLVLPDPPVPSEVSSQPAAPIATAATVINHLMRLFMSLSLSRHEQRDR